jgi:hypothetical protein
VRRENLIGVSLEACCCFEMPSYTDLTPRGHQRSRFRARFGSAQSANPSRIDLAAIPPKYLI